MLVCACGLRPGRGFEHNVSWQFHPQARSTNPPLHLLPIPPIPIFPLSWTSLIPTAAGTQRNTPAFPLACRLLILSQKHFSSAFATVRNSTACTPVAPLFVRTEPKVYFKYLQEFFSLLVLTFGIEVLTARLYKTPSQIYFTMSALETSLDANVLAIAIQECYVTTIG